jgi:hypothetical protein
MKRRRTPWTDLINSSFKTQGDFCNALGISRPTGDKLKHEPLAMMGGKIAYLLKIMEASGKSAKEVLSILNETIKGVQDGGIN